MILDRWQLLFRQINSLLSKTKNNIYNLQYIKILFFFNKISNFYLLLTAISLYISIPITQKEFH